MNTSLLTLLDSILGTHQRHANGEFYWSCPFCHHAKPKLAINIAKGAWHCWVCNASGKKLIFLLRKLACSREQIAELAAILQEDIRYIQSDPIVANLVLPAEYIPLYKPTTSFSYKHALRYITARGLTAADILRYQIGYCPDGLYANRIIVPSFDEDGKLNYFVGRSIYEDGMKYKNPPVSKNVIGFENSINWNYMPILCEGVYDAIAIKRNAIPLLGKTVSQKLYQKLLTSPSKSVCLCLDADALRQTTTIAERLMSNGISVYYVKLIDLDPSDLGFTQILQLINKKELLTFSSLMRLKVSLIGNAP